MAKDLSDVLSANVRALLARDGVPAGEKGQTTALMRLGYANGTATRLLKGSADFGLEMVARLAETFRVEPWQLLVPDMQPTQPPRLLTPTEKPGWPFDFEVARWDALLPKEQGMVEHAALTELERIEQRHKPPAALVSQVGPAAVREVRRHGEAALIVAPAPPSPPPKSRRAAPAKHRP